MEPVLKISKGTFHVKNAVSYPVFNGWLRLIVSNLRLVRIGNLLLLASIPLILVVSNYPVNGALALVYIILLTTFYLSFRLLEPSILNNTIFIIENTEIGVSRSDRESYLISRDSIKLFVYKNPRLLVEHGNNHVLKLLAPKTNMILKYSDDPTSLHSKAQAIRIALNLPEANTDLNQS